MIMRATTTNTILCYHTTAKSQLQQPAAASSPAQSPHDQRASMSLHAYALNAQKFLQLDRTAVESRTFWPRPVPPPPSGIKLDGTWAVDFTNLGWGEFGVFQAEHMSPQDPLADDAPPSKKRRADEA